MVGSRLFKDAVPAIFSWLRSFPILCRQPRSLSSVSGLPARWSCVRGWLCVRSERVTMGSAVIAPLSPHGDGRGFPLSLPTLASLPRAENHRLVLWAIWGLQWEPFRRASPHGPFTPPAAAVLCGSPVILLCRLTAFHSRAVRGSDVDRSIGGWAIVLWGWKFGGVAPSGVKAAASATAPRKGKPQSARRRGRLLCPPELLRPVLNRHLGRRVEPLAGARRPPCSSWPRYRPGRRKKRPWHRQPGDVGSCSISGDGEDSAAPSPEGGLGENHSFCSAAGSRALLPFAAPPRVRRLCRWSHLHGVWRRGLRCPARLIGSRAQFDSATRFSLPGDLPSSAAFSRHPSWQRMQSSRSLQPRWGRGFTALISSYPRKAVVFDQSWICESWTGPCTGSRSRCWRTGAWSNASSPGIGLQRSTWKMLTFMCRSFRDTDRSYGLRPRVGHGSTRSSPSGSPCPHVSSRRSRRAPLPRYGKWASGSSTVSSMARAWEQLCDHRDLVLRHLSQLGLRVNREKSKLSPAQRISFLGVELDSVSMTTRLTDERAQSVLNCPSSFRGRTVVLLKQFQRLLGHMASTAAVTPLGLLHMRPLQHWLHSRVPRWAWCRGTLWVNITQECHRSFSPWMDLAFLRARVPLEQVSRHVVVTTDASSTGLGATCNRQAASGLWMGPRLLWHINCLELLAVHLALRQFGHCC